MSNPFPLPPIPGQVPQYVVASPANQFRRDLYAATPRVWVTPLLVAANVIWFIVMLVHHVGFFDPDPAAVLNWGADYGPYTTNGQWWRLFTSMFVHFGIMHIAVNMIILAQAGPLIERLFGNLSYAILYIFSGLCGSLLSLKMNPGTIAGGASGAIFGVYGGLFGFLLVRRGMIPRPIFKSLVTTAGIFVVYNVAFGAGRTGIDNAAHGGGLVSGAVLGAILSRPLRPGAGAVKGAVVALICGTAFFGIVRQLHKVADLDVEWQKVGVQIDRFNKTADDLNSKKISADQFAATLQDQLIPGLEQAQSNLASLANVAPEDRPLWQKQLNYLDVRLQHWQALELYFQDPTPENLDKANQLHDQADKLAKEL